MRKTTAPPVPARLHVLLARKSHSALIIRRGPSRHVCSIGWDLKTDTFTLGQWFKGRIYERRCDLSPNGKHFIYFAMNGKWHSEAKGSWTAISRSPYLKAVALWAKGDCWFGGGLFTDDRSFWLNGGELDHVLLAPKGLRQAKSRPSLEYYGGECPGVYYLRLQRDGWKRISVEERRARRHVVVFEKQIGSGWVLRKFARATLDHPVGKGCYFDTHALLNPGAESELEKKSWEWADFDRKRLLWAEDGKLFAGQILKEGITRITELHDFNDMKFEALAAPY
jgi:hypothetical protein